MSQFFQLVVSNVVVAFLLALFVWALSLRVRNPHLMHALWLVVLVKLVTPPLAHFHIPWSDSGIFASSIEVAAADDSNTDRSTGTYLSSSVESIEVIVFEDDSSGAVPAQRSGFEALTGAESASVTPAWWTWCLSHWQLLTCLTWGGGAILLSLIAISRHRRLARVIRLADEPDSRLMSVATEVAKRIGIKHCPDLRVTAARVSPLVTIFGVHMVILLPQQLLQRLDSRELRSILAHEMSHLKRRDHWVRGFELLVLLAHWWNPIAWWASRRLRLAEEECCDATVLHTFPENRGSYGNALLTAVEFLTEGPTVAPIAASPFGKFSFHRRIEMIMKGKVNDRMSWTTWLLVLLAALVVVPVAAQTNQNEESKKRFNDVAVPAERQIETKTGAASWVDNGSGSEASSSSGGFSGGVEEREITDAKHSSIIQSRSGVDFGGANSDLGSGLETKGYRAQNGLIRLVEDVLVPAKVDGLIEQVDIRVGDTVKKGEILVRFDKQDAQLRLAKAVAELQSGKPNMSAIVEAELTLRAADERFKLIQRLRESNSISITEADASATDLKRAELRLESARHDYETSQSNYEFLKVAVDIAQRDLERCSLVSPLDGVVLEVKRRADEPVRRGDIICRIVNLKRLAVDAYIDESLVEKFVHAEVKIVVERKNSKPHATLGKVVFVSPIIEDAIQRVVGSVRIRAEFDNVFDGTIPAFRPGMRPEVLLINDE